MPIVAHAFSQSEYRIGTQLIFPNSILTPLKPKEFCSCHQPACYAYYFIPRLPPKEGHQDELILEPLLSFPFVFLFLECWWLVADWRRLISCLGKPREQEIKPGDRCWFNTVCMPFPLHFVITLTTKWFYRLLPSELCKEKYLFHLPIRYSQRHPYNWLRGGRHFIVLIPSKQQHPEKLQDSSRCWEFFAISLPSLRIPV